MAWVIPALTAASAVAGLGSAALNATRSNAQQEQQYGIAGQGAAQAQANAQQQAMIEALINQRSIAGYTDSQGNALRYDPYTNQWVSTLGALPQQAQTAADQAAILRNTVDFRQQQAANEQAALRAAQYGPYADTTRRQLESYRPMSQDEMIGLLTQQAALANNYTYRPLVADTLRTFARTGTGATNALAAIGKQSADSLRDSLIEARLKGMQGTDQINQGRRGQLEGAATTAGTLATPSLGYTGINPADYSKTMANLMAGRAQTSSIAPAYGAGNLNAAQREVQASYGNVGKAVPNPNFGLQNNINALDQISTSAGKGGNLYNLAQTAKDNNWFGSGVTPANAELYGGTSMYGPVTSQYNFLGGA